MRVWIAILLSLLCHVFLGWLWFYQAPQPNVDDRMSLDAIDFNLGIVAAQTESTELVSTNSESQVSSQKGGQVAASPVASINTETEVNVETPQKLLEESELIVEVSEEVVEVAEESEVAPVKVTEKVEQPVDEPVPIKKPEKVAQKKSPQNQKFEKPKQSNKLEQNQKAEPPKKTREEVKASPTQELPEKVVTSTEVGDSSVTAQSSVSQTSEVTAVSQGGKATQTQADSTKSASYIAGLQRKIAASANRLYPKKAKRKNLQGVVMVGFFIRPNGDIEQVSIIDKSDYPVLDKAALKSVKRIGSYQPPPEGIKDYFVIPISFKLR